MSYLKPYGTIKIYHVTLTEKQRLRLLSVGLIDKKQKDLHINFFVKRLVKGHMNTITITQKKKILGVFESLGYRSNNGEVWKTQIGSGGRFQHN